MSEKVIQSRKQTLDLLLSDHNIHCFSCEGNGDCKLQDYAYEYGLDCSSYEGEKSGGEIDDSNKFFTYDPSLCILCHRCVNTCNEIVGRGAIATMERGFQSIIGNGEGKWADGTCESCGNCVQACPDRRSYYEAQKEIPCLSGRKESVDNLSTLCNWMPVLSVSKRWKKLWIQRRMMDHPIKVCLSCKRAKWKL